MTTQATIVCSLSPLCAAVPAPTITSISTESSTSIRVRWSFPSPGNTVSGYRISYSPSSDQCAQIEPGSQTVDGGAVIERVLTGLEEGVDYEISVQARGVEAYGNLSGSHTGTTHNAGNWLAC